MERIDPLTGETFLPERTNQLFASRYNQVRYNNMKAAKKRKAKAHLDRILDNNRRILKTLLGDMQENVFSRDYLLGAGFDFNCQTHNGKIGGMLYNFIYEYAYIRLENNQYKIIYHGTN
jgi:hypothetical protein